jgi:hypothetical protein
MYKITMSATASEFLEKLEWARSNCIELNWLSVPLDQAIELAEIEAETDSGLAMPYDLDIIDDDHATLCMLKWGVVAERSALRHRLPPKGRAIYDQLAELALRGKFPSEHHTWESGGGDRTRIAACQTPAELQEVFFGDDGILAREIEALEFLKEEGVIVARTARKIDGDKVNNRWGNVDLGIEALTELRSK